MKSYGESPGDDGVGRSGIWALIDHVGTALARLAGLVLLLVGVWGAVQVLGQAWDLYRNPDSVSRFGEAVERGTHIDRALLPANRRSSGTGDSYAATGDDFRPSHVLGWVVAIIMLLVLGRLAYWLLVAGSLLLRSGPRAARSPPTNRRR